MKRHPLWLLSVVSVICIFSRYYSARISEKGLGISWFSGIKIPYDAFSSWPSKKHLFLPYPGNPRWFFFYDVLLVHERKWIFSYVNRDEPQGNDGVLFSSFLCVFHWLLLFGPFISVRTRLRWRKKWSDSQASPLLYFICAILFVIWSMSFWFNLTTANLTAEKFYVTSLLVHSVQKNWIISS